jgi:PAS domain S-box-containing protein
MLTGLSATTQVDDNPLTLHNARSKARIHAEGEMADRIRGFPWATTSLGDLSGWSETLLCAVNTVLDIQFPALLFWGSELAVLYNDAYQPLMAERHPRVLGQSVQDCWSEAWHIIGPQCQAVMEQGRKLYFENVLIPILREGVLCDVYWTYSYSPVRDPGGKIVGIIIVSQDVTARLTAERERDTVAANLKNVLESTTDGLVVTDNDGRYTYVNEQAARIVALTPADMVGKTQWELFPRILETQFGAEYQAAVETGKPRHFDSFYPEPLNAWLECHCYPSEHGVSVYFRDVTEQKQTEKALRASEARFRKLFESDLMGICIPDRYGAFRESNDELLRMTGYTRADQDAGLVRWDTMTPPEYAELDATHIREAAERGGCTPYEKEYIRKDGSRVPILCGYALLEGSEDEYIGFVLDLSEQKRTERELREREERFRSLADSLPQLIWMTDRAGENIYCNQRYLDYLGVTEADRTSIPWLDLVHPDDLAPTLAIWNHSVESGEPYLNEFRLRRKDGMFRYLLARAIPIRNDDAQVERWIGSATDIHDQKLAEDALRKSEKLATAGRLAASIAHEINNPLAGVTNSLYLALQDATLNADTKTYLLTAEQELQRVAHITTQTLRFHKQSNSPAPTDVCDIVDSVLALFGQRLASKNIQVAPECHRGAVVTCFGDELRQVVANLVGNALDAMPEGGVLRVRVRQARSWAQECQSGVKIIVADSGYGIPAGVRERIFEPFVSTKEATGIGLGLWVSEGIVRKHRGIIRVRSRAGTTPTGTVFAVFIPSAEPRRELSRSSPRSPTLADHP